MVATFHTLFELSSNAHIFLPSDIHDTLVVAKEAVERSAAKAKSIAGNKAMFIE
jgi:hypothetical protein